MEMEKKLKEESKEGEKKAKEDYQREPRRIEGKNEEWVCRDYV